MIKPLSGLLVFRLIMSLAKSVLEMLQSFVFRPNSHFPDIFQPQTLSAARRGLFTDYRKKIVYSLFAFSRTLPLRLWSIQRCYGVTDKMVRYLWFLFSCDFHLLARFFV